MRNCRLAFVGLVALASPAGSSFAQDPPVTVTAPAVAPPAATPSGERPQLVGRWKLNPDKSDDARAKMREAMAARRQQSGGGDGSGGGGSHSGGGHMGGGGMGGGGHMGGGGMGGGHRSGGYGSSSSGSQPSDDKRAAMRAAMDDILEPGDVLTITQQDPDVTVTADDGRVRHYFADGRKVKGKDGAPEQTTKWDGPRLVVESKIDSGPTIHESYTVDSDGKALQLTARILMANSTTPVIIHRQYDLNPVQ